MRGRRDTSAPTRNRDVIFQRRGIRREDAGAKQLMPQPSHAHETSVGYPKKPGNLQAPIHSCKARFFVETPSSE